MITRQKGCFYIIAASSLAITICTGLYSIVNADDSTSSSTPRVIDYGDMNTNKLVSKIKSLSAGEYQKLYILQLGDSHTAGEFLTDQLRTRLQGRLGNGGIGWVMPMNVAGQRHSRVNYQNNGWRLTSSRTESESFPLGGLIAKPLNAGSTLSINNRNFTDQTDTIRAVIRQSSGAAALNLFNSNSQQSLSAPIQNDQWQYASISATLPITIEAKDNKTSIGGWWLENNRPGAIVSAMGINGYQQSQWSRWRSDWDIDMEQSHSDLVILSYGTNEAFNNTININEMKQSLTNAISRIRSALPNASILLVGAPESLKNLNGYCGTRPTLLDAVQAAQKEVAQQQKTLYWDWQRAMGGSCSMKSWINQKYGAGDGIHFSSKGYQVSADDLYLGIMQLAQENVVSPAITSKATVKPSPASSAEQPYHATVKLAPMSPSQIIRTDKHIEYKSSNGSGSITWSDNASDSAPIQSKNEDNSDTIILSNH